MENDHGFIEVITSDVLKVLQDVRFFQSLDDHMLHRLEQKAWIKAKWAETETGRRAKFYSLTAGGRAQLEKEATNWTRLSAAIDLVVDAT